MCKRNDVQRERYVEKILTDGIRRLGGKAFKFVSPGNNGVPDRLIVMPEGKVCFVELKTETGKLSDVQRMQIRSLQDKGQHVAVLYGVHDVRSFLIDLKTGCAWSAMKAGLWTVERRDR